MRSKIRWFTEFCNSHYLSHFAAFFIDARTKRSVVESFNDCIITQTTRFSRVLEVLWRALGGTSHRRGDPTGTAKATNGMLDTGLEVGPGRPLLGNDPSAGSPTETLLRLLLPLNDQV